MQNTPQVMAREQLKNGGEKVLLEPPREGWCRGPDMVWMWRKR